ncbi:MAG: hypothetical protein M3040_15430 [Bacteroidota bacterium]|nr:hypothetical protein [Bacteroidota bacterium]
MTEIKIEKKKPVWPWVLLGLGILALLLYFFLFRNKSDQVQQAPAAALIDVHENNSTVAAYVMFINSDTNKMTLDHSFTNEALLKLTDATNAMANAVGFSVKADLDKAKDLANKITNDPFETSHADNIKKAANIIARALENLQQAKYPELQNDASEVKIAAESINAETLTLDQRDAVKTFFGKAANLLQKMN